MDDKLADDIAKFAKDLLREKTKDITTLLIEKIKESAPAMSFLNVIGPAFVARVVDGLGSEIYSEVEERVRNFVLTKLAERNGVVVDTVTVEFIDKRTK